MVLSALTSATSQLDELLAEICRQLQITAEQRARAETSYRAVGDWLGRPGGRLSEFEPEVYPQGSIALGTMVRPRGSDEYDVDLVLEVARYEAGAMRLYEQVLADLLDNGTYRDRLERKARCVRINYLGDFHLDVLPARHDDVKGGTSIEVPDRKLRDWKPSNPRGYRGWFEDKSTTQMIMAKEAEQLPPDETADQKPVLKRVVQLMKRHRDVAFMDRPDNAPREPLINSV